MAAPELILKWQILTNPLVQEAVGCWRWEADLHSQTFTQSV